MDKCDKYHISVSHKCNVATKFEYFEHESIVVKSLITIDFIYF